MLYIFLVDPGKILTFDINFAFKPVNCLKKAIRERYKIEEDKQVFIVSGGVSLKENVKICTYSAGTDTNPVFLFNKSCLEQNVNEEDEESDSLELVEEVERCLNLNPSYSTLSTRTQLAQHIEECSKERMKACEFAVRDQHFMQQAWASVLANLEDNVTTFEKRSIAFLDQFLLSGTQDGRQFLDEEFSFYQAFLQSCPDLIFSSICILARLPSPFLSNHLAATSANEQPQTMLEWLENHLEVYLRHSPSNRMPDIKTTHQNLFQIPDMTDYPCQNFKVLVSSALIDAQIIFGIASDKGQKEKDVWLTTKENFKMEASVIADSANNDAMKRIGGLENRLFGLERLLSEVKKLYLDQTELARGFVQNQIQAQKMADVTILPDLCSSHKKQLTLMLKHFGHIKNLTDKAILAKKELANNIRSRLKWVSFVQKQMCSLEAKFSARYMILKNFSIKCRLLIDITLLPISLILTQFETERQAIFENALVQLQTLWLTELTAITDRENVKRNAFLHAMVNNSLIKRVLDEQSGGVSSLLSTKTLSKATSTTLNESVYKSATLALDNVLSPDFAELKSKLLLAPQLTNIPPVEEGAKRGQTCTPIIEFLNSIHKDHADNQNGHLFKLLNFYLYILHTKDDTSKLSVEGEHDVDTIPVSVFDHHLTRNSGKLPNFFSLRIQNNNQSSQRGFDPFPNLTFPFTIFRMSVDTNNCGAFKGHKEALVTDRRIGILSEMLTHYKYDRFEHMIVSNSNLASQPHNKLKASTSVPCCLNQLSLNPKILLTAPLRKSKSVNNIETPASFSLIPTYKSNKNSAHATGDVDVKEIHHIEIKNLALTAKLGYLKSECSHIKKSIPVIFKTLKENSTSVCREITRLISDFTFKLEANYQDRISCIREEYEERLKERTIEMELKEAAFDLSRLSSSQPLPSRKISAATSTEITMFCKPTLVPLPPTLVNDLQAKNSELEARLLKLQEEMNHLRGFKTTPRDTLCNSLTKKSGEILMAETEIPRRPGTRLLETARVEDSGDLGSYYFDDFDYGDGCLVQIKGGGGSHGSQQRLGLGQQGQGFRSRSNSNQELEVKGRRKEEWKNFSPEITGEETAYFKTVISTASETALVTPSPGPISQILPLDCSADTSLMFISSFEDNNHHHHNTNSPPPPSLLFRGDKLNKYDSSVVVRKKMVAEQPSSLLQLVNYISLLPAESPFFLSDEMISTNATGPASLATQQLQPRPPPDTLGGLKPSEQKVSRSDKDLSNLGLVPFTTRLMTLPSYYESCLVQFTHDVIVPTLYYHLKRYKDIVQRRHSANAIGDGEFVVEESGYFDEEEPAGSGNRKTSHLFRNSFENALESSVELCRSNELFLSTVFQQCFRILASSTLPHASPLTPTTLEQSISQQHENSSLNKTESSSSASSSSQNFFLYEQFTQNSISKMNYLLELYNSLFKLYDNLFLSGIAGKNFAEYKKLLLKGEPLIKASTDYDDIVKEAAPSDINNSVIDITPIKQPTLRSSHENISKSYHPTIKSTNDEAFEHLKVHLSNSLLIESPEMRINSPPPHLLSSSITNYNTSVYLTKSRIIFPKIQITNLSIGDVCLFYRNPNHKNLFEALSLDKDFYFLHVESYPDFKIAQPLTQLPELKRSFYGNFDMKDDTAMVILGQIESKEYCLAKKFPNRFNLLKGQKFYRVKASCITFNKNYPTNDEAKNETPAQQAEPDFICRHTLSKPIMSELKSRFEKFTQNLSILTSNNTSS